MAQRTNGGPDGLGYGDPALLRQGGHREWRSRNQKTASRTGKEEEYATHYTAKFWKTPPAGERPPPLVEVRPQERVQRHTVVHIVDVSPFVQILDVPVPQIGNQQVEFMQRLDTWSSPRSLRTESHSVLRRPQKAEKLVEVPTVVSLSLQQQSAEQNVDIPVPRTRGDHGGPLLLAQGYSCQYVSLSSSSSRWMGVPSLHPGATCDHAA